MFPSFRPNAAYGLGAETVSAALTILPIGRSFSGIAIYSIAAATADIAAVLLILVAPVVISPSPTTAMKAQARVILP